MIHFSLTSLLTTILFSNVLLIILVFLFWNVDNMIAVGLRLLPIYLIVTILRLALPVEFSFSKNIPIPQGLSVVIVFLQKPFVYLLGFGFSLWNLFLLTWLIGIIVSTYLLYADNFILYRRVVADYRDISDEEPYRSIVKGICNKYNKKTPFRVLSTSAISVPMAFGLFKPLILVPYDLPLNEKELYYILNHEAAHYYHRDLWLKLLLNMLCNIYWWNPFVPALRKQISTILEMRVDNKIVNSSDENDHIEYLACLIRVAKIKSKSTPKSTMSFSDSRDSMLKKRFYMLTNGRSHKRALSKQLFYSFIVFGIYLISIFFIFEPYYISPDSQGSSFSLIIEDTFLILNPSEGYDLYVNGEYMYSFNALIDAFKELNIYETLEEALHEK